MGRLAVTARTAQAFSERWQFGAEAAVGQGWGALTPQREWYLGGVRTVRGYAGGIRSGRSMVRGRVEVARGFEAARWALFSDLGWAGDDFDARFDETLWSVGVGASLLEGLVRLDLARGLRGPGAGWRLDLHLDGLL